MQRLYNSANLYKKKFRIYPFEGDLLKVFGSPAIGGCWIVYGKEKNGKTWASLLLAKALKKYGKTLYISAEEGFDKDFVDACERALIPKRCKGLHFLPYQSITQLRERLNKRRSPKIVFLDNATVYAEEMRPKEFKILMEDFPKVLFVLIAHEERNQPYTALAGYAKKIAKRIILVKGLACEISGRGPGGRLIIDTEKAALCNGQEILQP